MRYFACCLNANVVLPANIISLFDSFLDVQNEIEVEIGRSDAFVWLVMTNLPWAAPQLRDRNLMELERIYSVIENYVLARRETFATRRVNLVHELLSVYSITEEGYPYAQKDVHIPDSREWIYCGSNCKTLNLIIGKSQFSWIHSSLICRH